MIENFNSWKEFFRLNTRIGELWNMKLKNDSPKEDELISGAARELLEGISDADMVSKIQNETTLNLRDQVSLEQAQDWARDRDLRGFVRRN